MENLTEQKDYGDSRHVDSLLLCTIIPATDIAIRNIVDRIKKEFKLINNKVYILKPTDEYVASNESEDKMQKIQDPDFTHRYFVTYNVERSDYRNTSIKSTFQIHRKRDHNVLYTLNALNELIKFETNGELDKDHNVDWPRYRNCIVMMRRSKGEEEKKLQFVRTMLYNVKSVWNRPADNNS